ncbi:MAG: hypothetical protein ACK5GN_03785 [Pseudomonadota bacterium]
MPVKLARLLLDITIGCCFDSHPRIDSVLQNSGFRYGLLENAINPSFREGQSDQAPLRISTNALIRHDLQCIKSLSA